MAKRISNETRATAAIGGGATVTAWLAIEAQRRYGVPAEVGATVIGGLFSLLGRWAAKLQPSK